MHIEKLVVQVKDERTLHYNVRTGQTPLYIDAMIFVQAALSNKLYDIFLDR